MKEKIVWVWRIKKSVRKAFRIFLWEINSNTCKAVLSAKKHRPVHRKFLDHCNRELEFGWKWLYLCLNLKNTCLALISPEINLLEKTAAREVIIYLKSIVHCHPQVYCLPTLLWAGSQAAGRAVQSQIHIGAPDHSQPTYPGKMVNKIVFKQCPDTDCLLCLWLIKLQHISTTWTFILNLLKMGDMSCRTIWWWLCNEIGTYTEYMTISWL